MADFWVEKFGTIGWGFSWGYSILLLLFCILVIGLFYRGLGDKMELNKYYMVSHLYLDKETNYEYWAIWGIFYNIKQARKERTSCKREFSTNYVRIQKYFEDGRCECVE